MKSFTKPEGKAGILSYGLYMIYKNRFKYNLVKNSNSVELLGPDDIIMNICNIKYMDKESEVNVPYNVWLRICKKFNKMKMESIREGVIFKMPYRLGSLGIVEEKIDILDKSGNLNKRKLIIDWNRTLMLWKELYPDRNGKDSYKDIKDKPLCYYTNEHTGGRIFTFHWKKKYNNIKNKSAYSFSVAKQHRYALRDKIKSNPSIQFCTKF